MRSSFLVLFYFLSGLVFAQAPDWSAKSTDFQYSMNITAFLNVNGNTLINANDKVGAFVGNQSRGEAHVVYNVNANKYVAYLTVLSNTPGETVTFKVYDSANDVIISIPNTEIFEINKVIGGAFQSYSIANPQLKNTANFNSFTFNEITPSVVNINESSIEIVVPQASVVTSLTPVFTTKDNATVYLNNVKLVSDSQTLDFTNPVELQVLSEDESVLKNISITVSIAQSSQPNTVVLSSDTSETNQNIFYVSANFANELVALKESDFSILNGAVKELVKQTNNLYIAEIIAFNTGEVQIEIPEDRVLDTNNNKNFASNQIRINYDKNAPFIKEIKSENGAFTIYFSEDVTNVSLESFELKGVAKEGFTLEDVTQITPSTYKVSVNDLETKKGNLSLHVKATNTIKDKVDNALILQNFNTFYVDNEAPIVSTNNFELDLNGQTSASISVSDIENSATDNIGILQKELSKTTFTSSDIGTNTITYTVTDLVGNTTVKEVIITVVDKSLLVDRFSLNDGLQVFPNPIRSNWVTISSKNINIEHIFIFDVRGRTILQQKVDEKELKLNLEKLTSGIYFLKITSSKEKSLKRIIIN